MEPAPPSLPCGVLLVALSWVTGNSMPLTVVLPRDTFSRMVRPSPVAESKKCPGDFHDLLKLIQLQQQGLITKSR
jgi:hypothetical protein